MNELSLEERTVGFFLKTKDNVTSYGSILKEREWIVPFLKSQEDYITLQQVGNGCQLESPTQPDYAHLTDRNPFVGLCGEQAYAIHQMLRTVIENGNNSVSRGLPIYASQGYQYGFFPFFMGLAEKLGVQGKVKSRFKVSVYKEKLQLWVENALDVIFRRNDPCNIVSARIAAATDTLRELECPSDYTTAERNVMNVLARLSPKTLEKYDLKYGAHHC